jgi:hypothetical protein
MNGRNEEEPARARIAVALSGGGHRATLFALGVLMYLVDSSKNRQVTSIASVSGGSTTNGFVAQNLDFQQAKQPDFEQRVARPLAQQIAQPGTLFAPLLSKAYIVALVLGGLAVFLIPIWYVNATWWVREPLGGGDIGTRSSNGPV